jgi:ribosome assembly protein RRB1
VQHIDEQEIVDVYGSEDDEWDDDGEEMDEAKKAKKKKKKEKAMLDEEADTVGELPQGKPQIWNDQNEPLKEDEELEFDNSAYQMLHRANVEWPCLSIDTLV